MSEIKLTGWRPGLNKVALTRELQRLAGLPLGQAKRITDNLLECQAPTISLANLAAAEALMAALISLGVTAEISHPAVRHAG